VLGRANAIAPERVDAAVHLIEAYAHLGRHDDAEAMVYIAIEYDDASASAYMNMGEAMLLRGRPERAAECFRQAITVDDELPRARARLAAAYADTGRYERARQLFLQELSRYPGDIDTLLDLGCLLIDMNRFVEAGEKFRRVLEIESDNPDAHFYLGDLALRQGRSDEAAAAFEVVIKLDPNHPEADRRLAEVYLDRDLVRARRHLRRAVKAWEQRERDHEEADLRDLGEQLADARMHAKAASVWSHLAAMRTDSPEYWHALSVARFETGDRTAGLDACRRVLKLDPEHASALHNAALCAIHDKAWSRARYYARRLSRIDPDDALLRRLKLTMRWYRLADRLGVVLRAVRRAGNGGWAGQGASVRPARRR